jgi:hypothetical protein
MMYWHVFWQTLDFHSTSAFLEVDKGWAFLTFRHTIRRVYTQPLFSRLPIWQYLHSLKTHILHSVQCKDHFHLLWHRKYLVQGTCKLLQMFLEEPHHNWKAECLIRINLLTTGFPFPMGEQIYILPLQVELLAWEHRTYLDHLAVAIQIHHRHFLVQLHL